MRSRGSDQHRSVSLVSCIGGLWSRAASDDWIYSTGLGTGQDMEYLTGNLLSQLWDLFNFTNRILHISFVGYFDNFLSPYNMQWICIVQGGNLVQQKWIQLNILLFAPTKSGRKRSEMRKLKAECNYWNFENLKEMSQSGSPSFISQSVKKL